MAQLSGMEGVEMPDADLTPEDAVSMEQQKFWSELGSAFGFEGVHGAPASGADDSSEEGSSFYTGSVTSSDEDEGPDYHLAGMLAGRHCCLLVSTAWQESQHGIVLRDDGVKHMLLSHAAVMSSTLASQ